jgi:hypothetical protein
MTTTHTPISLERAIEQVIDSGTVSDDTDPAVLAECARRYVEREAAARARRKGRSTERTALLKEEKRSKLRERVAAYADEIAANAVVDWKEKLRTGEVTFGDGTHQGRDLG